MSTMLNCDDCRQTSAAGGCSRHQPGVIGMLAVITHVHEWRLAGQLADTSALLVCPHHDPPETRVVLAPWQER